MQINLVVLKTSRPDALADFYSQLGIEFQNHKHDKGPLHYAAEINNVVFEIYPLPKGKSKADDTLRLGFELKNLNETIEKLRNSGCKIVREPSVSEFGYVSIIEDLDGRKIELKEY